MDIEDKIVIGSSIWVPDFDSIYDDGQLYHSACKLWNIEFCNTTPCQSDFLNGTKPLKWKRTTLQERWPPAGVSRDHSGTGANRLW